MQQRIAAIEQIYQITLDNAKLEYEATVAAAEAEQMKAEAALRRSVFWLSKYKRKLHCKTFARHL